jgi:hypothetical protein
MHTPAQVAACRLLAWLKESVKAGVVDTPCSIFSQDFGPAIPSAAQRTIVPIFGDTGPSVKD